MPARAASFSDTILREKRKKGSAIVCKGVCECVCMCWLREVDLDALITTSFIITAFKVVRHTQTVCL